MAALVVAFAVVAASSASGRGITKLERVRYSTVEARARVVLDLSAPCRYDVSGHHNPERVAINLTGVRASSALAPLTIGRGGVKRIRINRLSWGVQVVVDLEGPATWRHFVLARSRGRSDRVVLDIIPGGNHPIVARARSGSSRRIRTASARGHPGAEKRRIVVAIDAGHGGKDPGARGRYRIVEKRATLDIARRIARKVNATAGFRAVLTRRSDVFLTLPRRTRIARAKGADAFVSVHLNTAPNRRARGTEIYFVTPAGAARTASRFLANPARAASQFGLDNPGSDVLEMILDIRQQSVLRRSESLAESILHSMSGSGLPPARTVKQKSFSVLRDIAMPSVLVEAAFISNRHDASVVRTVGGRERIAEGIAGGIIRYFRSNPPPRRRGDKVSVHLVRRGDTLWTIARKYGTTVSIIRATNKLGRSSVLRPGQKLLVSGAY